MSGGRRDEGGQATLMIVGFAMILILLVGVVIDSSAAYLQRQGLDNIADGAALHGADQGAAAAVGQSLEDDTLEQQRVAVRRAVSDYLARAEATRRFPGLVHDVRVDAQRGTVTVVLRAPVDLPLRLPGTPAASVTASGTAAVLVQR